MASKTQNETKDQSVEPQKITDAQLDGITTSTREALEAQPKVPIRLYQAPEGQPQLSDVTVQINGYTYLIKRGERVEVPQSVAEVLEQANHI